MNLRRFNPNKDDGKTLYRLIDSSDESGTVTATEIKQVDLSVSDAQKISYMLYVGIDESKIEKGGLGSGHPEHDGRPGEKGGSKVYEGSRVFNKHGGSMGSKDRWGGIMRFMDLTEKGGSGSGNFGHEGRPGEVGGSAGDGGGTSSGGRTAQDRGALKNIALRTKYGMQGGKVTNIKIQSMGKEIERDGVKGRNVTYTGQYTPPEGKERKVVDQMFIPKDKFSSAHKELQDAEDKGGETMGMIIQSILLPKGQSLDILMTQKGLEFLADADQENRKEFDKYVKFEQMAVEKFDKDSLTLVKISESGAWAIGGKVLDEKNAENALSLGQKMDVPQSPMNMPVAEAVGPAYVITFGEVFGKELNAFMDVVTGVLSQSGRTSKERKEDIMKGLNAFGSFLDMSLDALGEKAVKIVKPVIVTEKSTEGGEEEMFKTKEEFVAAFKEAFDLGMKEYEVKRAEAMKMTEDEKKKKEEEEKERLAEEAKKNLKEAPKPQILAPEIAALTKTVAEISKSVKELAEKTDKISNELATDPAAAGGDEAVLKAKEKDTKSVFKGVLFRALPAQQ